MWTTTLLLSVLIAANAKAKPATKIPAPSPTPHCLAVQIAPDDAQAFYPDPSCTPGVTNPAVTQANIQKTICQPGYTATIRPPTSYTSTLKKQQMIEYGYADQKPANYEEDHLISLELGGHPSDPHNLWPEPHPSRNEKDEVENELHDRVCAGTMTLAEAQDTIAHHWYDIHQELYPADFPSAVHTWWQDVLTWLRQLLDKAWEKVHVDLRAGNPHPS